MAALCWPQMWSCLWRLLGKWFYIHAPEANGHSIFFISLYFNRIRWQWKGLSVLSCQLPLFRSINLSVRSTSVLSSVLVLLARLWRRYTCVPGENKLALSSPRGSPPSQVHGFYDIYFVSSESPCGSLFSYYLSPRQLELLSRGHTYLHIAHGYLTQVLNNRS